MNVGIEFILNSLDDDTILAKILVLSSVMRKLDHRHL